MNLESHHCRRRGYRGERRDVRGAIELEAPRQRESAAERKGHEVAATRKRRRHQRVEQVVVGGRLVTHRMVRIEPGADAQRDRPTQLTASRLEQEQLESAMELIRVVDFEPIGTT